MLNRILEAIVDFLFGRWITLYSSVTTTPLNETKESTSDGPE